MAECPGPEPRGLSLPLKAGNTLSSQPLAFGSKHHSSSRRPSRAIQSALSPLCAIFSLFLGSFRKSCLVPWSMHVINCPSHLSIHTHSLTHLAYLTQGMRRGTGAQHGQTVQLHVGKSDPGISLHPTHPQISIYSGSCCVCAQGKSTVDWRFMRRMPPCLSSMGPLEFSENNGTADLGVISASIWSPRY